MTTNTGNGLLLIERVQSFLDQFMPGSKIASIHLIEGDFTNYTHLIEVEASHAAPQRIVLRTYNPAYGSSMSLKANIEFNTLSWLHGSAIPVAEPLHLDPDGSYLGSPGFAMHFVPGSLIMWPDNPPSNPIQYATKAAAMLASIHLFPCEPMPAFLVDGNGFVLWFLRSDKIPGYLLSHPDGPAIWNAIHNHQPDFRQSKKVLHHGDYWEGNLLWEGDEISGVMDWEEAGYAEPGADVAYFMMGMYLIGHPEAAEAFLSRYEAIAGKKVEHLAFWELAAAVRPINHPEGWIDKPPFQERLRRFVAGALSRI